MGFEGYASLMSVAPGAQIAFYLNPYPAGSNPPGPATLGIQRVGQTPIGITFTTPVPTQTTNPINPWEGYGWSPTYVFTVPTTWPTGLYSVFDTNGGDPINSAFIRFVVLPTVPGSTSKVLYRVTFLTRAAYNPTGGKSLYGFNSMPSNAESDRATQVSFDRPGGAPAEEVLYFIPWLEAAGIPVEYCACVDLEMNPNLLSNYDCYVSAYHDEYWTKNIRDQVENFLGDGGNLIILSGNTCYRQVRLEQNNRMVVFYKYAGNDPNGDDQYATVAFAEPPLNWPQNRFLGAGFTAGAFNGVNQPYKIRFPSHWVFAGVSSSLIQTQPFMNYETDAAAFVEEDEGYPRVTGEEGTPLSYVVLASADLRSFGKPGYATMGIFRRNGTVFNGGTTEWIKMLDPGNGDPIIQQVTRNVFQQLRTRLPWDWEDIGHADFGRALTAADNKLFLSTSSDLLWRRYPVGAEVVWRQLGRAPAVIAMAATLDTLFFLTADNNLWWRPPAEQDVPWRLAGRGPGVGTRALAALAGMLYAIDTAGRLWRVPAAKTHMAPWVQTPHWTADPAVNAMCADADILFASTSDGRLLRTDRDFISEATGWVAIHHCDSAKGLAVIDKMLYAATAKNRLLRLDLWGLRRP